MNTTILAIVSALIGGLAGALITAIKSQRDSQPLYERLLHDSMVLNRIKNEAATNQYKIITEERINVLEQNTKEFLRYASDRAVAERVTDILNSTND
jgi:hypothetical protein